MDFLNRAFLQVKDLFLSMTPGARVTTALLLGVIVVSLGYLFAHQVSGSDVYLMGGESFSAGDLKAMEAAFGKAGLSSYRIEGSRVSIPRGQQAVYMAALVDANAVPPDFGKYLTEAVEASNPFLTAKQIEGRKTAAKEKELSLIIRSLPGIEKAAVLFDSQTERGVYGPVVKTASVAVKALGSQPLDSEQVRKIRHLVAGAFAGMKPEHVTVADMNGQTHAGSGDPASGASAEDDPYIVRKREHEKAWQLKILAALAYVPGVSVTTNVELNKEQVHRTEELKPDPKAVPYSVVEKETSRKRDGGGPGGQPGYAAQQPKANAPTAVRTGRSAVSEDEEQSSSESRSVVGGRRVTTEDVGLTPKLVKAAVGIPTSYFVKVWQERNPPAAGAETKAPDQTELAKVRDEEMKKIRGHVATLLLPAEGVNDLTELVTVTEFQDITPAEVPVPTAGDKALGFLGEYWATLGMLGLAGFSLLMLRSMARAALPPLPSSPRLVAAPRAQEEQEEENVAAKKTSRLARFAAGGPSLKDELSELVAEDPDAAANILRAWIGTPQ